MSHRRIWIAIAVTALFALIGGGTTLAVASPHATAAKKHHKKKKKGVKCSGSTQGSSTITSGPNAGDASYYAYFHCKKTVSQFTLTTNKPVKSGSVHGVVYLNQSISSSQHINCTSGTNTIKCSGLFGSQYVFDVHWLASGACATPTMLTTTVNAKGKVSTLSPSCS